MLCDNYRTVTLLCTTYKILANIFYAKLVSYAEKNIGEYQGGLQRGRSTVDQIFTMRQILEKCWEQNMMYLIYLLIFKQDMTLSEERKYGVKCIN
jgi:hypothetical protein